MNEILSQLHGYFAEHGVRRIMVVDAQRDKLSFKLSIQFLSSFS